MTRGNHRPQKVPASRSGHGIFSKLLFIAAIPLLMPLLVPLFLGEILATPFVARRHESTFRWLLFMMAQFLGPVILIGVSIGLIVRRLS